MARSWIASYLSLYGRHWITRFGASLATVAFFMTVLLGVIDGLGIIHGPYVGIVAFLVMPAFFVTGLVLIPIGSFIRRRRGVGPDTEMPVVDLNRADMRRQVLVIVGLSVLNVLLLSYVSYAGIHHMDSVGFCGTACHTVMEPEFTAYQGSAHSRVACVSCHIGPGAPWFVKSKLSGLWQVVAVATDIYPRPIPSPVENLRPSRDTCEQCHWPQRFTGDRVRVIRKHADDETSTPLSTVLVLHVGGGTGGRGIHGWHLDANAETTYAAEDEQRQKIPWVQVRRSDGTVVTYKSPSTKLTDAQIAELPKRRMDCIDCHNRPTHTFQMPDQAVDEALTSGRLDRTMPYIRKLGIEVLQASAAAGGEQTIEPAVRRFYAERYPEIAADTARVQKAAAVLRELRARNVFPRMNVGWGTYPINVGHERWPGCFRCHDGEHVSTDGRTIRQDCEVCHATLAVEEPSPEILAQLGVQ
jgi:hypothetical protein